jgi:hypothetical protein
MSTVETILSITPDTKNVERLRDLLVEASRAAADAKMSIAGIDPDVLRGFMALGAGGTGVGGQGPSGMSPLQPTPGGTGYGPGGQGTPGAYSPGAGPSGNPGDGRSGGPKPGTPQGSTLQKILYGGQLEGRNITGLGGLGLGGYMMGHGMNTSTSAFSSYMGQEATEQSGLVSGSIGGALSGVSQAYFGRERAKNEGIGGAFGIGGGGLTLAGGVMMGAPGGQAAGIAMMIAGSMISAGSQAGVAMGNSLLSVLQAKEAAAFETYGDAYRRRSSLSNSTLQVAALGGLMPSESEMFSGAGRNSTGLIPDYGYTASEIAQKSASFSGAGGYGLSTGFRLAGERGLGIQGGTLGRYMSSLSGGQANGDMVSNSDEHVNLMISNAVVSGLHKGKISDYLMRIAATNESLAMKGAIVSATGVASNMAGLQAAGFLPMQAAETNSAVNSYSGSMVMKMGEQRLPQQVVEALIKRKFIEKYGGWDEAMKGMEGEIKSGDIMQTLSGIQAGLPDNLQAPMGMAITGMFPSLAKKFGQFKPQVGPGGNVVGDAAKNVTSMPEFELIRMSAIEDAVKTLSITIPEISKQFDTMLELLDANVNNFKDKFPVALQRLLDTLSGKESGKGVTVGGVVSGAKGVHDTVWDRVKALDAAAKSNGLKRR